MESSLPQAFYQAPGVTIYHGRWEDILPALDLPANTLLVTDPPYGTGGWRRLTTGAGRNPSGSLIREDWDDGATDWLCAAQVEAVLAFWPPARTLQLLQAAKASGLDKHRCLYMRKRDPKPMPGGRTRWSVEPIWVLGREGFMLMGGDDVLEVSTPRLGRDADATGHPYEKPLDVMRWLLAKVPGRFVVDPFCGSGTTLVAAQYLGVPAIGIEQDIHWCEVAAQRLAQPTLLEAVGS